MLLVADDKDDDEEEEVDSEQNTERQTYQTSVYTHVTKRLWFEPANDGI